MSGPEFIDHLVLRVSELSNAERFYTILLAQKPRRAEDSIMYQVGDTRLFLTVSRRPQGPHDKEGVGLNHVAFGVRTIEELQSVRTRLDEANVVHSGIRMDHYGQKEFIWLDDPDNMRIEFYLRPSSSC
jgi:glyoxylase I family protein